MVEFKANVATPEGKTYAFPVWGNYANSLIGKKIGDEVDGLFVGLPGYKLVITGGSDNAGFPMRKDIAGQKRVKVLLSESTGFHPKKKGLRKKVSVRGNTISPETAQINMKIIAKGPHPVEKLLEEAKKRYESEKEKKEEKPKK
ncbi:MAG: 30S ribosomal protein S6e [Thermoplasmata archaeon]